MKARVLASVPFVLLACTDPDDIVVVDSTETSSGDGDGDLGDGDGDSGDGDGDLGDGDGDLGDGDGDLGDGDGDLGDGDGDLGDGDGDGDLGDGDGDVGDGDGDGDLGDGDGDVGDGDGDVGDGDGDMGDGDGDGDMGDGDGDGDMGDGDGDMGEPCPELQADPNLLPCGDGLLDPGEACDEGENNGLADHCDYACGFVCEGPCPVRVDVDAPPGGSGSSWADARDDLQATVDELSECGGTVWVAEGSYLPAPNEVALHLRAGISVYGGFAGTERTLEARDWSSHPSLIHQDQPELSTVWINQLVPGSPVRFDGFVVTGGKVDGDNNGWKRGGGIRVDGAGSTVSFPDVPAPHVLLHNLELHDNEGAIIVWDATVELRDAWIHDNLRDEGGAGLIFNTANVLVHDTLFADNGGAGSGAVVHEDIIVNLAHFGQIFMWNTQVLDSTGGAIHGGRIELRGCRIEHAVSPSSAAVEVQDYDMVAEDTVFAGNINQNGPWGGAIRLHNESGEDLLATRCTFIDNQIPNGSGGAVWASFAGLEITDSRFITNSAGDSGGALFIDATDPDWALLADVEFVANSTGADGGAIFGPATVVGGSFHANQAGGSGAAIFAPGNGPAQLRSCAMWPDAVAGNLLTTLDDSCVPAGLPGFPGQNNAVLLGDPFVPDDLDNDGIDEHYLDPASSCVDLGGFVDEFEWSSQTTQVSQCTDAGSVDAGAHHPPLLDAGVCG